MGRVDEVWEHETRSVCVQGQQPTQTNGVYVCTVTKSQKSITSSLGWVLVEEGRV